MRPVGQTLPLMSDTPDAPDDRQVSPLAARLAAPRQAHQPEDRGSATDQALRFVRRPIVGGIAAGLLIAGSLPPWGFWPLAFVGLFVVDRLLAGASWTGRLGRGFTVGVALFAPTVLWISQLTGPGYVLSVLIFALITGLFFILVPPGAGRRPALVGAWMLAEGLRMAWPFGGVPLSLLAVGQVAGPLAGIARVGGVLGIGLATVAVAVGLSAALDRSLPTAKRAVTGGVAIGSALVLLVVSVLAPHGHETGKALDIAFVQGGGAQGTRAINTNRRKVFLRHYDASARVPKGLDLVLWPEDVVDTDGLVQRSREGRELQSLARRLRAPLVVGTVEGVSDTAFRNSSQVLDADGVWGDRYVKVQRVPFGEWVPFRSIIEHFAPDTLAQRDATVSHQSGLIHTPHAEVAVVISWEVFFGHRARSGVRAGGQLLYNPTNGSTYTGTFVQTQQVASSRLRAIETGRWEVQVAPTGFSAFVSPEGKVHQRTATKETAVRVRRGVPLRTGRTWYVDWGDLPGRLASALLIAIGWAIAVAAGRRRPGSARVSPAVQVPLRT